MSAFESGSITCASAFGGLFMKSIASTVLGRFGYRTVLIFNAILAGMAIAACGLFTSATPHLLMLAVVLLGGFFPSLQFTSLNSIAYADIPSKHVSRATSLASVIQQLSLGLGVAIAGLTLQLSHHLQGHTVIENSDFWPAFLTVGLFSVASIPLTRRLAPDADALPNIVTIVPGAWRYRCDRCFRPIGPRDFPRFAAGFWRSRDRYRAASLWRALQLA